MEQCVRSCGASKTLLGASGLVSDIGDPMVQHQGRHRRFRRTWSKRSKDAGGARGTGLDMAAGGNKQKNRKAYEGITSTPMILLVRQVLSSKSRPNWSQAAKGWLRAACADS